MYESSTETTDAATPGDLAQKRNTEWSAEFSPLAQEPIGLAQWGKHDASNYYFATYLIQRRLVAALSSLEATHGSRWMSTRKRWSYELATEIAEALKTDGCRFPVLYADAHRSKYPLGREYLQLEDISELGFDVSGLAHEDMAEFASLVSKDYPIERVAGRRQFGLAPLISRQRLEMCGLDATGITDAALLRVSAAVHEQMAGFDPKAFPQDFDEAIRSVATSQFGLPTIVRE